MTETGHPGPAALVELVEAAHALVKEAGWGLSTIFSGPRGELVAALEKLERALYLEAKELDQEEAGHWEPATWSAVRAGDRIRVGGQHEAEVEVAMAVTWLGSGAAQVPVKLKDRGHYTMPPSGPVEVWRPSLPDWAAQAFATLAGAGLMEGASRG